MRNIEKVKGFFNSHQFINWKNNWVKLRPYSSKELRVVYRGVAKYAIETRGMDPKLFKWARLERYPQLKEITLRYKEERYTHRKKIKQLEKELDAKKYLIKPEKQNIIDKNLKEWINEK